ncbi:sodium:proton antiporter [Candidatus Gracilibacteria bacterium]|nr:sodium:proton antiporter [Candidatus Gracilibacteria bacterium]
MGIFYTQTLSFILLLLIAGGITYVARVKKIPSAILLVITGFLIAYIAQLPFLGFIDDFELSPAILFYILLPVLLFESAYHTNYRNVLKNIYSISALAGISLLISSLIIAVGLWGVSLLLGYQIPFIVFFLFGALISATDTATTLGIFKDIGIPKRLKSLFEGESLFNDGTAIALFIIILSVIQSQTIGGLIGQQKNIFTYIFSYYTEDAGILLILFQGMLTFIFMLILGVIVGVIFGIGFSKLIQKVHKEPYLEVSLSFILAHITFLVAEAINFYILPVSGIIATVTAAMILGNYGRYKISRKVEQVMQHYWGFFTFVSNNLLFLLVGILIVNLDIEWISIFPLIVASIIIVFLSRGISIFPIFGLIAKYKSEEAVPKNWQLLLSTAGLRGAIAIMLVLLVPESLTLPLWSFSLSLRDTLLALTISVVLSSLFLQTLCIKPTIKYLEIERISDIDEYRGYVVRLISYYEGLIHLQKVRKARYVEEDEGKKLSLSYEQKLQMLEEKIEVFGKKYKGIFGNLQKRVYALYALGVEEKTLINLYRKDQVPESIFKKILSRIKYQQDRIESGKGKIQSTKYIQPQQNLIEVFSEKVLRYIEKKEEDDIKSQYYELRTLDTIIEKALGALIELQNYPFFTQHKELQDIIDDYKSFKEDAERNRRSLFWGYREELKSLSGSLTYNTLISNEILLIERYIGDRIISEQVGEMILEET